MNKHFLGCDWGTSSFRMWLFNTTTQKVEGEVVTEMGIGAMHTAWQNLDGAKNSSVKIEFFRQYLKTQIAILSANHSNLDHVSIVFSGMASSSIGIDDVPYATLPFAIDGSQAVVKQLLSTADFLHEILLISGVRSHNDVMRGEETQLIGLMNRMQNSGNMPHEGIFILPGTHSKHIHVSGGFIIGFRTFMTGELFKIVSDHSILKSSLENNHHYGLSNAEAKAFKLGVQKSREGSVLNSLFTVRTNRLFDKLSKKENTFYLSGLLIGEELNYLLKCETVPLVLCTASNLSAYYKVAIEELDLLVRTTLVVAELVDQSALAGQNLIFRNKF